MQLLFWISLFLFLYTFAGYPVFLYVINSVIKNTEKSCKEPDSNDGLKTVEVILIVRNVQQIITKKIESLYEMNYPSNKFKILIVSDSSDDDTVAFIKEMNHPNLRCIENLQKSSKSACLNQAIALSDADILLMTDARQSHEPNSLRKLVSHFANKDIGAVSGELVLLDPETNQFAKGMDAYWRYEKFIRAQESKIASVPGVTGAIYAMRRSDFEPIPNETLLDDVLIPMNMILKGKRVLFESDAVAYDVPSDDPAREKIRKTRTLAGNWQLIEYCPQLLNPFRNRIWLQFLSHKMFRLLAPLYLLLILFSSGYLVESSFFLFAFVIQVVGYSLLFGSIFIEPLGKLPLVKTGVSFMTLMWFTVLGFWSFFTRQHLNIWK